MLIGYARVSTLGQDLETQKEILKENGCEKIFVEKVTAASTAQRTELKEMLEFARENDTVYVTKIDRLARSITDLHNIVNALIEKGVNISFIQDNLHFVSDEKRTAVQELMLNVLGAFAQFERDLIVSRTSEGRERARKKGKHLGRPARPKQDIEKALKLYYERKTNGMSVNDIVKITGVPRSTIYHQLKLKDGNNEQECY